jgi:hypothetical protein
MPGTEKEELVSNEKHLEERDDERRRREQVDERDRRQREGGGSDPGVPRERTPEERDQPARTPMPAPGPTRSTTGHARAPESRKIFGNSRAE